MGGIAALAALAAVVLFLVLRRRRHSGSRVEMTPVSKTASGDDKVGQLGISSDDKSKSALLWDEVASCVCSPLCRLPRATPAWADCRKLAGMSH